MSDEESYTSLGIRMYGKGVFAREPKPGSQIKASTLYSVEAGHFIYNRMFAAGGSFGVITDEVAHGVVSNEFPLYCCEEERLLTTYLAIYFQQPDVWGEVERECTGTTKSRNRWKEADFERHEIQLPPVGEQRRIVDVIGGVDAALEAAEEYQLKAANFLSECQSGIPYAPEVRISDAVLAIEGGTSVAPLKGPNAGSTKRILKVSAVRPAVYVASENKPMGGEDLPTKAMVREGDLLITRSNTPERVGYVCVARDVQPETYIPDLIWRLVPDESKVTAEFLEHALSGPEMRDRITSTASGTSPSMKKINRTGFRAVRIPAPSLEEQSSYVDRCRAAAAVVREAVTLVDALKSLRSELVTALLSGAHAIPSTYDELMSAAI
ncbi:restriction endonuclease subunit S domain-containing protein [Pseudarthrobacter oxydans]|uniref:hypothetical protein n=1 Tax=Pseudarthrobacter oxydans TaxID=1671 RepID=UPI003803FB34